MQRHYHKYIKALKEEMYATEPLDRCQPAKAGKTGSPTRHYSVSDRSRGHVKLYRWALSENANDPALKVRVLAIFCTRNTVYSSDHQDFIPNLKDHLLARILCRQHDQEHPVFTDRERNEVHIVGKRLEQRFTMTVYHTTYDLRRGADKINMKGRPYVFALSRDNPSHPYVYARVLGIYRVKVLHPTMAAPTNMDVLWVRWFQLDHAHRAGWKAKRLYRVQFVPSLEEGAFGFLDPDNVIRGSHLIPCFDKGLVADPPVASISRWDYPANGNWYYYYINQWAFCWSSRVDRISYPLVDRFVDRDMFMRYRGGGVGHTYMRAIEEVYENMSRERIHHKVRKQKGKQPNNDAPMNVDNTDGACGEGEGEGESESEGEAVGSQAGQDTPPGKGGKTSANTLAGHTPNNDDDDDEDDDDDYVPDSDSCSSVISDSDDLDSGEDREGYESYGLGDL